MKPKVIFLVGPTAAGKTAVAIELAKKINAEIISCDSMQIYKGMDIITSKVPLALQRRIPHHLIDLISPTREYNVSQYRWQAIKKIKSVLKKGKIPLFAGGTGFYMAILIDGIFQAQAQSKDLRQKLYHAAKKFGSQRLYDKLSKIDPQAAEKIHPHDLKRVIRALEVYQLTGKPISKLQTQRQGLTKDYEIKIFCLNLERAKLYHRIEARVERMFYSGLIEEVKKLLKLKLSRTAACAIGIKELAGYFQGSYNLEQAKALMKRNTRLYAKRQLTWFRKDQRIDWIKVGEREKPRTVAERIYKKIWSAHS